MADERHPVARLARGGAALGDDALYALAEEISLTTYYPSPMGVYQELRVGSGELNTPHAKLQVNKPEEDGGLAVRVTDQPNDSTPFVIDQDGNVGIGTTDPGDPLHVKRTAAGDSVIRLENGDGTCQIYPKASASCGGGTQIGTHNGKYLCLYCF